MIRIGNLEVYGIIYKIENLVNGKVYIGQTMQSGGFKDRYENSGNSLIERYYNTQLGDKNSGRYYNAHLLKSIEKYGFNKFDVIEYFDIAFSKDELDMKEISWISIYNSTNPNCGYNRIEGGNLIYKTQYKTIICLNTLEIFESISQGAFKYGIENSLRKHLSNPKRQKSSGRHPITNEKLVWMYYDEYLQSSNEYINEKIKLANIQKTKSKNKKYIKRKKRINKPFLCLHTNEIFYRVKDAMKKYNIKSDGRFYMALNNQKLSCGKDENGNKLYWKYI